MVRRPSDIHPIRQDPSEEGGESKVAGESENAVSEGRLLGRFLPWRLISRFSFSLTAATAVLLGGSWLSSGTMAPYAATLGPKLIRIRQPCGYLTNIDHDQFQATFWMLQGGPQYSWEGSLVLRRILYPILAYPLMRAAGFDNGGFATNLIITLAAFLGFIFFVRRAVGERGAVTAMWLLATYPGIAYWIGLPYSYVWIVPGSSLLTMLLWKMARTTDYRRTFLLSMAIGFLFWGYDLFPFFGMAALLILTRQRRFLEMPIAVAGMIIPVGMLLLWLGLAFHVPLRNSNTESYWSILTSFTSQVDLPGWSKLIADLPSVLVNSFFFSTFLFLPLLFFLLALASLLGKRSLPIESPELEILLATLLVFLVNNLAPPYPGWQLRGIWIARLYQPVFVAFVLFACRSLQRWWESKDPSGRKLARIAALLVALTVIADAGVVFGPVLRLPIAAEIYFRFYRHSGPESRFRKIDLYGRRPWGICKRGLSSG